MVRLDQHEEGLSEVEGNGLALVKGDFVSSNNSHLGCRVTWRRFFHRRPPSLHANHRRQRIPVPSTSPHPVRIQLLSGIVQLLQPLMRMVMERGFISRGDLPLTRTAGQPVYRPAPAYYFNHRAPLNHVCTLGDKLILEGTWTTSTTISSECCRADTDLSLCCGSKVLSQTPAKHIRQRHVY